MTRRYSTLSLLAFAAALTLGLWACGGQPSTPETETSAPAPDSTEGDSSTGAATYEPAYPQEVSEEGLSEADVSQQEAAHDHGDDEDEHSHDHGDGEGEHSHGDENGQSHEH